jgi:chemotaxis response regulator CheB
MRVLCVGRHAFLSEHLCRIFRDAGAECEPAVGATEALRRASELEPHVIVCDCDLITPALLDSWATDPTLGQVPVLAVSLTRGPEESTPVELYGLAAVIYLPSIEREQLMALLAGLRRPRGVTTPPAWQMPAPAASVHSG